MRNKCELLGFYGGDKTHCLSAWTSTFQDLDIELPENVNDRVDVMFEHISKTKQKTPYELLDMLATHNHGTPFEKSAIHFIVNTDIATHIQLLKHRIAVPINAESARYKELKEDKFYLPEDWNGIEFDNDRFISYTKDTFQGYETWKQVLERYTEVGNELYHECLAALTPLLGRKRAKESARFFKTYNSQITADVMFNFRSFIHFQKLRNDEHAQLEIRELAAKMLDLVFKIPDNPFQYSLKSFGYESR